jgi:hypothetical protein
MENLEVLAEETLEISTLREPMGGKRRLRHGLDPIIHDPQDGHPVIIGAVGDAGVEPAEWPL